MKKVKLIPFLGKDDMGFKRYYDREYEIIKEFYRNGVKYFAGKTESNPRSGINFRLQHEYWVFRENEILI